MRGFQGQWTRPAGRPFRAGTVVPRLESQLLGRLRQEKASEASPGELVRPCPRKEAVLQADGRARGGTAGRQCLLFLVCIFPEPKTPYLFRPPL